MPTVLKIIVYPVFAFFCLALFTVLLFPYENVKYRLSNELEKGLGGQYSISIGELSPRLPSGAVLKDVEIRPRGDGQAQPVKISKAKLGFALSSLFSGGVDVDFDLRSGQGKAKGSFAWKKGAMNLDLHMDRVETALIGFLIEKLGVPLEGLLNGDVQMELYPQDPLRNTGKILLEFPELKMGEVNVGGGVLQIPPLVLAQAQTAGSPLPKMEVDIDKGNFEVKSIAFSGGSLELTADGKVYGARRSENYRFNLKGNFKVAPEVAEKIPILLAVEKQKAADGSYPFSITGRFSKPNIRIGDFKLPI